MWIVLNPTYPMLFPIYEYLSKFNFKIRQSKRLPTVTNNKEEQLQQYAVIKVTRMQSLSKYVIVLYPPPSCEEER